MAVAPIPDGRHRRGDVLRQRTAFRLRRVATEHESTHTSCLVPDDSLREPACRHHRGYGTHTRPSGTQLRNSTSKFSDTGSSGTDQSQASSAKSTNRHEPKPTF